MKTVILALTIALLATSATAYASPASRIPNLTDVAVDRSGNAIPSLGYLLIAPISALAIDCSQSFNF